MTTPQKHEPENWRNQEVDFRWLSAHPLEAFAIVVLAIAVVVLVVGFQLAHRGAGVIQEIASDFYANVGSELVSVVFTVLIVDRLAERRAKNDRKRELIFEMGAEEHDNAMRALRLLKFHGYDKDGSLNGKDFRRAHLAGADLSSSDLASANLEWADLSGTNLWDADLTNARLWSADLSGSYLWGVDFSGADLRSASLLKASIRITESDGVDIESLRPIYTSRHKPRRIKFDTKTILPNGKSWSEDVDMRIFTDPEHPDFWEPYWVKEQREQKQK